MAVSTARPYSLRSYGAASRGLEAAIDAARRLRVRPWRLLVDAAEHAEREAGMAVGGGEWHHFYTRAGTVQMDWRAPRHWDLIAEHLWSHRAEIKAYYAE
jgi:hypothetical protein